MATWPECTYELHWPYVDIHWKHEKDGVHSEPVQLVLVAGGELMRFEGEARRPLRRVWDATPPLPPQTDLTKPGAMAALAQHDPRGYEKVLNVIDIVQNHGCRGAWQGLIGSVVHWDLMACGSADQPPQKTRIGFWLGDERYFIDILPK